MDGPNSLGCLSIIVPSFNEEGNVSRYKKELIDYFRHQPFPVEFIFVDDGSTDKTVQMLEHLRKENTSIKIVKHTRNFGLGRALRSGFKEARGDAVLTLDADLTFHPGEFPKLLEVFSKDVDCVAGSPVKGQFRSVSVFRRILSNGVNFLYQIFLWSPLTSTSSIFRLYRSKALEGLDLTCDSFDINAEILAKMVIRKFNVREVGVNLDTRTWGVSKIRVLREIKNHLKNFCMIMAWRLRNQP